MVKKLVMEYEMAFCTSVKEEWALSGPPKASALVASNSLSTAVRYPSGSTTSESRMMRYSPFDLSAPKLRLCPGPEFFFLW